MEIEYNGGSKIRAIVCICMLVLIPFSLIGNCFISWLVLGLQLYIPFNVLHPTESWGISLRMLLVHHGPIASCWHQGLSRVNYVAPGW